MSLGKRGTNTLYAASAATMARYGEFAMALSGSALPGTERLTKKTHVEAQVHGWQTKRWTSIDSGPGSGAVCVQDGLPPISLEGGPKTLVHTKGSEVAHQVRRLQQGKRLSKVSQGPLCQCAKVSVTKKGN